MAFSDKMTDTAYKLIFKYGSPVQLIRPAEDPQYESGTHRPYWMIDSVKSYTPPNDNIYSGYAAISKPKTYELLDGRIRSTDTVFKCVQIPEPDTHDKIQWLTEKYDVIYVMPAVVQSTKIMYTVYARAQ